MSLQILCPFFKLHFIFLLSSHTNSFYILYINPLSGEKAWTTSASSLSPRIWLTVRGWRPRHKGFVSPDDVGKRRPSRPDRFQGFRLSLPGNGREGLRDSGRGGGRVRECACVCPEMFRLPQPPGRGHPTFSGCLPKAIDSSEKKSITTLRAPALDCTCPELTSFISRKQFYLIASWSF